MVQAFALDFGTSAQEDGHSARAANHAPDPGADRPANSAETADRIRVSGDLHVVLQGDTLWGIAREHAPENADLREYVYELKKANGLKTGNLTVGQVLRLP